MIWTVERHGTPSRPMRLILDQHQRPILTIHPAGAIAPLYFDQHVRLAATAPELLEALEEVMSLAEHGHDCISDDEEGTNAARLRKAHAAIAKAIQT